MEHKEKNFYTLNEIAKMRRITTQAVYARMKRKNVPSDKIGNTHIVQKSDLHLFEYK